jgi:glycoprotein-N-acetylgalactosamine 3-beta-galactosyltransferase
MIILLASYSQLLNTYPNRKIQILKKKLVCIVLTTENSFQNRAIVAWKTWTQKCDKTLFACNCSNFAINKNYTDIPFLHLNITENYNKMDVKVIQTLNETYKIYNKNYYWFLLVDEDTYVFVDNAKRFMSKINQTLPETYGLNFKMTIKGGYHSGGAGVLFTPESMKRIVNSIHKGICNDSVVFGDLLVGLCSERSNVTLGNSLDELGRERFHAINMRTSYKGPPQDWLYSYCSNTPKFGKECCSEQSITFHYTSPQKMIEYSKLKDESNLTVLFNKL